MLQTEIEMKAARDSLAAHCLCAKLIEENDRIVVMFPEGFDINAAQMRFKAAGVSRTKAFQLLTATCEKYWVRG